MRVSAAERESEVLQASTVAEAAERLTETGYVVLRDVFEPEWVARMHTAASRWVLAKRAGRSRSGQANLRAPRERPFTDPLALANPLALQVLRAVLGPRILRGEYWVKARLGGVGHDQFVHRDRAHLFPELSFALPAWCVAASIALTDFTEENGATEIWPGSHRIVDPDLDARRDAAERASRMPSTRLVMPAGSIGFRDLRAWHRGRTNHTEQMRVMLDVHYQRDFGNQNRAFLTPVMSAEDYLARRRERARRRLGTGNRAGRPIRHQI